MNWKTTLGLAVAATLFASGAARADDWVATKLRGIVLTLVDDEWVRLSRGDIVPDARAVRTLRSGRVTFQRGEEAIELGADTQIRIVDRAGQQYTTVHEFFGSVTIEAEVQNVEHFAVKTPHLAAVVKGTRFTVISDATGAKVKVERGHVAVEDADTHQSTIVGAGQAAYSAEGGPLEVNGDGDLPKVIDDTGATVSAGKSRKDASSESGNSGNGTANAGNGNSGNGNGNSGHGNSDSGNSGNGNSGNGNGNSGSKKDKD